MNRCNGPLSIFSMVFFVSEIILYTVDSIMQGIMQGFHLPDMPLTVGLCCERKFTDATLEWAFTIVSPLVTNQRTLVRTLIWTHFTAEGCQTKMSSFMTCKQNTDISSPNEFYYSRSRLTCKRKQIWHLKKTMVN